MSKLRKEELKLKFSDGHKPTGEDFSNLIDSFVHQLDDEVFVNTTNQNVGIGVDNPQNKLQVAGKMSVSGDLGIGTNNPNEKLTVEGGLSLKALDSSPGASPGYGKLYIKEEKLVSTSFNGHNSYVSIPSFGEDYIQNFTISVWFKSESFEHNRAYIVDLRGDGSNSSVGNAIWIDKTAGGTCEIGHCFEWRSGGNIEFSHSVGLIFGEWQHISIIRIDKKIQCFFNGKLIAENSVSDEAIPWNIKSRIGNYSGQNEPGGEYWFKGLIDDAAFWKRALSTNEVQQIYLAGRSFDLKDKYHQDLVSYLKMGDNENDTSKIHDGIGQREAIVFKTSFYTEIARVLRFKDGAGMDIILGGGGLAGGSITSSLWGQKGQDLFYERGKVGIGLENPQHLLDVNGTLGTNYLVVKPQNNQGEGGEIKLEGSGDHQHMHLDNLNGRFRVHASNSEFFSIESNKDVKVHGRMIGPSSDKTVGLHDGDNLIYFKWTGNSFKTIVDNTEFTMAITSDKRLKKSIKPISDALSKVKHLRGVTFEYKNAKDDLDRGKKIGFIAQEVEKIVPEVVRKSGNLYTVDYGVLTALMAEAIKELQGEIESIKKRLK